MYWAIRATQAWNSSLWGCALRRTRLLSRQGPGVSGWKGPPGPNLRRTRASTAARMSG
ncbi:hypothetical protein D3C83_296960 [compost metagenome]